MPATPATWLDDFSINAGALSSNFDPDIIQLTNGNILVSWQTSDDSGVGSPNGSDIVGQMFDPFGNVIGGPVRLNQTYSSTEELNHQTYALPDGGFIVVYDQIVSGVTRIRMDIFNDDGSLASANNTVAFDNDPGAPNYRNADIIHATDEKIYIVYERENSFFGTSDTIVTAYDRATETFTSSFTFGSGSSNQSLRNPHGEVRPDGKLLLIADSVLSDGSTELGGQRYAISLDANGDLIAGRTDFRAEFNFGEPSSEMTGTYLTNGELVTLRSVDYDRGERDVFIRVWSTDADGNTDSFIRSFDINSPIIGDNNNNEPAVTALQDGGFVVTWDDDRNQLIGLQRFDGQGNAVGSAVTVYNGGATAPEITTLSDGRLAVIFRDGGDIRMQIFDTRDEANTDGPYLAGTIGDDVMVQTADSLLHDGNAGDDTIIATDGAFVRGSAYEGGAGNDTIDFSSTVLVGAEFNLQTSLMTAINGRVAQMTGFESVIGTVRDDILIGVEGTQMLDGGGGDDVLRMISNEQFFTLTGGEGNDTLTAEGFSIFGYTLSGGDGDDTLTGSNLADGFGGTFTLDGGAGNDTIRGFLASDRMNGGEGDDLLIASNNTSSAITGPPNLTDGGAGVDTYQISGRDWDTVNLETGGALYYDLDVGGIIGLSNLTRNIENLDASRTLSSFDVDSLTAIGSAVENILIARASDDFLTGLAGDDTLNGGGGFDTVRYDQSPSGVFINLDSITRESVAARTALDGYGDTDTLILIEFADGSNHDDTIYGSAARNELRGLDGDDNLYGRAGNDTLIGGLGDDVLDGASGVDTADYQGDTGSINLFLDTGLLIQATGDRDMLVNINRINATEFADMMRGAATNDLFRGFSGDDAMFGRDGNDTLFGGAGADDIRGEAGSDRLYGEAGDDLIQGGDGVDIIDGGTGNDDLRGGNGGDRMYGRDGNDFILGDAGIDIINGQNGNDTIRGGDDRDILRGNDGDDMISGDGGDDRIDGGADTDTIVYAGNQADYNIILRANGVLSVEDQNLANGDEGYDVITNAEFLQFADGIVDISGL